MIAKLNRSLKTLNDVLLWVALGVGLLALTLWVLDALLGAPDTYGVLVTR